MSFRGPLLKPVGQKQFFAVSYSKPTLVFSLFCPNNQLFIADKNSNFFLPMEILENAPSKVGYFGKIAEILSTFLTTQSAQIINSYKYFYTKTLVAGKTQCKNHRPISLQISCEFKAS